ncbi:MAG: hypothetical protein GX289_07345 [Tissierellia bacterium]|jgi:hypothetical protein|nr:hypothetical protein [Tissierellia bacterium]
MKRFLILLFLLVFIVLLTACSNNPADETSQEPVQSQEKEEPGPAVPIEITEPAPAQEVEPYTSMDIFDSNFNPYADMELPDIFTVYAASFIKGSPKFEGRNPFILYIAAEGNMYAAVAYQADVAGLTEDEKVNKVNEYLNGGFCEFQGTDGRIVTIKQTKPHDIQQENGVCNIEITYNVADADLGKYTKLIRDNYNFNALASVKEYMDIETDFTECSIEVNLQNKEAIVAVQYYFDDAEKAKQSISDDLKYEWREWNGHPAVDISYGMIRNTLIFDSRSVDAVLILQTSNELNSPLAEYLEPEFSLAKFGFGFDDAGTCAVYEDQEPHYKSVAICREEWGQHSDGWNIELMDTNVNGYFLIMWYHLKDDMYHINIEKDGANCTYDIYLTRNEYGWEQPDKDTVHRMFNNAFGTQGDEFYDKPLAHFEQYVQERFGMSIEDLYALPKQ